MKKVILFFPIINPESKYHWFPFSSLVLGASLKQTGFDVVIIDQRVKKNWKELLLKEAKESICIGISSMTGYQIRGGSEASKLIKENFPTIFVAWGGRHPTLLPEQTIESPLVDIVVVGQGEITFLELVKALINKSDLRTVEGIVYKKDGKIIKTKEREITDVKTLDGFDFSLINVREYINPETHAFAYFSSFGCPNRCGFCVNSYLKRRWMSLEIDRILDDLEYLIRKYDFKNLIFQDSNFFVNKKRVIKIAQGFIDRNFNINWKSSARTDQLWRYEDNELELLKKSGLISLFVGVESGSQRMLNLMTKDTKVEDAIKTVEKLKPYGFELHASLIFGLPYETLDDLDKTIKHIEELKKINPNIKFQTCFYSPFPGNPLYDMAIKLGFKSPKNLEEWQEIKEQTIFEVPLWFDKDVAVEYERRFKKAFTESARTDFSKKTEK